MIGDVDSDDDKPKVPPPWMQKKLAPKVEEKKAIPPKIVPKQETQKPKPEPVKPKEEVKQTKEV